MFPTTTHRFSHTLSQKLPFTPQPHFGELPLFHRPNGFPVRFLFQYSRFAIKVIALSYTCAWLHQLSQYLIFSLKQYPSFSDDNLQKMATEIFNKLHSPSSTTHATICVNYSNTKAGGKVHNDPFFKRYFIELNPHVFEKDEKKGLLSPGKDNRYKKALIAHEAAHAVKNHTFYNVYYSTFIALLTVRFCMLTRFKILTSLAVVAGPGSYTITSAYISRQQEFEADRIAAGTESETLQDLKAIFAAQIQHAHPPSPFGLFSTLLDHHPSPEKRYRALSTLPKKGMESSPPAGTYFSKP